MSRSIYNIYLNENPDYKDLSWKFYSYDFIDGYLRKTMRYKGNLYDCLYNHKKYIITMKISKSFPCLNERLFIALFKTPHCEGCWEPSKE